MLAVAQLLLELRKLRPERVAHRRHPDRLAAFDHRHVAEAAFVHEVQRISGPLSSSARGFAVMAAATRRRRARSRAVIASARETTFSPDPAPAYNALLVNQ